MKRISIISVVFAITLLLGFQSSSHANLMLFIGDSEGHSSTNTDLNTGQIITSITLGSGWHVETVGATAPPYIGTMSSPTMQLFVTSFQYSGTEPSSLTFWASEAGFGPAAGAVPLSGSVNATVAPNMTAEFMWFFDKNNNADATGGQLLGDVSFFPPGGLESGNADGTDANGPYSLALKAVFSVVPIPGGPAFTIDNFDISSFNQLISVSGAVPEPTTMFLLGSGLLGLWGARRKFKK